jgi:hypothetical protein
MVTGFDNAIEFSGLEKPDAGQKPDPGQKPQPNPGQRPDLEKPDPGEKPASSVWVGFRCVAELTTDD